MLLRMRRNGLLNVFVNGWTAQDHDLLRLSLGGS